MTVSTASFRQSLPEFADTTKYPEAVLQFWLTAALALCDPSRWAELLDTGVTLLMAHNIVLAGQATDAANRGLAPGTATGVVNNKAVDKVHVGYDVNVAAEQDAGNYNLTTYGQRFIHFARMIGAGPVHIGQDSDPTNGMITSSAYLGPIGTILPNPSN